VRILNFPFSRPQLLLNLGADVQYERASSSVTFLSKNLPTCGIDDVFKLTDSAVRTGGSLIPSHKTDICFKSAPIKSILGNCQISKSSSSNKVFFMIHYTGFAEAIKLMTSRIWIFLFFRDLPSSSHFLQH
jgi:hypothetical protein